MTYKSTHQPRLAKHKPAEWKLWSAIQVLQKNCFVNGRKCGIKWDWWRAQDEGLTLDWTGSRSLNLQPSSLPTATHGEIPPRLARVGKVSLRAKQSEKRAPRSGLYVTHLDTARHCERPPLSGFRTPSVCVASARRVEELSSLSTRSVPPLPNSRKYPASDTVLLSMCQRLRANLTSHQPVAALASAAWAQA